MTRGASADGAVEAVFRIESARIIAGVARIVRDVGIAEELAQDALVAALEQWPESGVPDNPGAWLMATARHRAIDLVRRRETYARKLAEVGRGLEDVPPPGPATDAGDPDRIDDDLLRLIFTACHPVLSTEARIALTLRLLGGLTTDEIARAFLAPEPTVAQRIVRAKRKLAAAGVPFEVPYGPERAQRLTSVLEVIYLIFNEGYSATAGDDWLRPALCEDALRLGRVLAGLMPGEPEVHGLVALIEIQASRTDARTGRAGEPVLLADQDRARWNRLLVRRGFAALARAGELGAAPGPYALQAAIAACHARARTYAETDWQRIALLYAALPPSPVVELNRAVAVSMAEGPAAGLAIVDVLAKEPALAAYHLLPSVRGDLLERLGRAGEAAAEFERAAALTRNEAERTMLLRRASGTPDPARREALAQRLLAALRARCPGSRAELRGSLARGTADPYSDIDLLWIVPDAEFDGCAADAAACLGQVREVVSVRSDPDLQRSRRRRLLFVDFRDLPLFWRLDLEITAASVEGEPDYDSDNPSARGDDWSVAASALANAVAAVKAVLRQQPDTARGLLERGLRRVGVRETVSGRWQEDVARLADAAVRREPAQRPLAERVVRLAEDLLSRSA